MPTPKRRVKLYIPPPTIAEAQQAEWDASAARMRERLAAVMAHGAALGAKKEAPNA
jgi:hypothetical protein